MPSITFEIELYCEECGTGICNNGTELPWKKYRSNALQIKPCETCLQKAREEGIAEGESNNKGE